MRWIIFFFGILNLVYGITGENEWLKALNYIVAGLDFGYLIGWLCYKTKI